MTTLEEIDDLLPQTQCRQCGCDGCLAYARAILEEGAAINRCAPGGAQGIARLAAATGRPVVPLDPEYGHEAPFAVARIRARDCIGCAWCVRVCPTDAIAGAPKHLHGIVEERCTGCALCLPACPMDAIDMIENGRDWTPEDARRARARHRAAKARRERLEAEDRARLEALRKPAAPKADGPSALIAGIMARARMANAGSQNGGRTP